MSEAINPVVLDEHKNDFEIMQHISLPWQDILDRMDAEKDAFLRMKIVLYELLPAITTWKEDDVSELADKFENSVDLVELLDEIQELFNDTQGGDPVVADKLYDKLGDLHTRIEQEIAEGRMNPALGEQIQTSVQSMLDGLDDMDGRYGQPLAHVLMVMWYNHGWHGGSAYPHSSIEWIEDMKKQVDGYHDVGAGLSGHSAALEAELQFEIGNLQQFYGIQSGMYENDIAANRNHINKLNR